MNQIKNMKVSIIIINYKSKETTAMAIDKAMRKITPQPEIILIDNNSEDGSIEYFREKYRQNENIFQVANDENYGFAKAVNQGIKKSSNEYILLLNSDVFIKDDFMELLEYAEKHPEAGVIGPRMVYGDSCLQYSFGRFPNVLNEFFRLFWLYKFLPWGTVSIDNFFNKRKFREISSVSWVTGGCMLISKNALEATGYFDENYFFGVEDIDFCYRVKKAGKKVIYFPKSEVLHLHGFSSGGKRSVFKLKLEKAGLEYFYKKFFPKKVISTGLISWFYFLKINLIKFIENKKIAKIEDVVAAITYQCDSRCRMCNIWQLKNENKLMPEDFKNLPETITDLNITGGEPFLHENLFEIIKIVVENNPKTKIVISTNGFATGLIREKIKRIKEIKPDIGVAISLDGGEKIHEEVRRIPGAYHKVLNTIKILKEEGIKNLKISFTLGDYNIRELRKIYALSKKLGVEFSLTAVHSSGNYFNKENNLKNIKSIGRELDWLIKQELKAWQIKKLGRAYYAYGLKKFIQSGKRILPDYSGIKNIFIDPKKDVYHCDVSEQKIGSIIKGDLIINNFSPKNCANSWMICTARPAIKKHKIKALIWLVKNKFLSL